MASAIGIAVATRVRKTISSTMNAAMNPSSSCIPCWIGGDSASPLNSDGHPRGLDRLPHGVLHGNDRVAILGRRSRRSNWASAYAIRPLSANVFLLNGSPTLSIPARSAVGLNSLVFSCAIAFSIAALRAGVSSRSTLGRSEDEVEDAALLGGELRLDEIRRLLRVRARDLELVLEAAADGGDEHDQPGDDREPREDDAPRVIRACAHPARECAGRQSFVCCESFLLGHAKTPRLVAAGNDPPTRRISSVELDGVCLAHGSTNSVALRA